MGALHKGKFNSKSFVTYRLKTQNHMSLCTSVVLYIAVYPLQCVVGGTNMDTEIKRMKRTPPHILVATPGRLVDHLQNQGASEFMSKLDTLVFDEADRLLDMGFRYSAPGITHKAQECFTANQHKAPFSLCLSVPACGLQPIDEGKTVTWSTCALLASRCSGTAYQVVTVSTPSKMQLPFMLRSVRQPSHAAWSSSGGVFTAPYHIFVGIATTCPGLVVDSSSNLDSHLQHASIHACFSMGISIQVGKRGDCNICHPLHLAEAYDLCCTTISCLLPGRSVMTVVFALQTRRRKGAESLARQGYQADSAVFSHVPIRHSAAVPVCHEA